MKKDLLTIINNYGLLHQLEYLQSEVWELNDAITTYESEIHYCDCSIDRLYIETLKKNIIGELADNYVLLYQIKEYKRIDIKTFCPIPDIKNTIKKELKEYVSKDIYKLSTSVLEDNYLKIKENIIIVFYKLKQFQKHYGISSDEIKEIMNYKIKRQLKRMKNERLSDRTIN